MELSLAEFACFNLRSKQQILQYKANHISCISINNIELQLYSMNGDYIMMHTDKATGKPVRIETVVPKDMLYLFADQLDVSGLLN